ncbi:hypothetical protein Aple_010410 [Acrocarpospora pleiomorpha]|uniref:Uncharacterized protein n=1 Tax=Acrocarpospora pleiomorpha TaxID=90975 RepID=A0A5M3XBW3_9ACTN|nr:hypothetical protein [Acrocarpospora pleiomorpha]GES18146.1 hypothetical protein Aple_010410 [Acrocarpospora pleiomorpha]
MSTLIDDRAVQYIRRGAERLPADGPPIVGDARQRAMDAAETVAAAVAVDPTLPEHQRRNLDLLVELMRQLTPLARQAGLALERERLVAAGAPAQEIARLGLINQIAPEELDALSLRCPALAVEIAAAAMPDWNTPQRIRERSEQRLPADWELQEIADQLRRAVTASLDLPYPAAEAVRLAALADQISPTACPPREET